jgi:sugar-phosphatase
VFNTTYDAVFFDLFGTLVDDQAVAMPGALDCLVELQGVRWAVVTSCGTRFASALLAHAGLPQPPLLVTADDVERNKPAPDGYLLAAANYAVDPGRALVIEDSVQGIASAREAGMDVVAILRGRSPAFARAATFVGRDIASLRLRKSDAAVALELPL